MKASINAGRVLVLASLFALALPTLATAQGRGRGRGEERQEKQERKERREENKSDRKLDRKCAKFVNCHDASDGRRDGKGPDRRSSFERSAHRYRNRDLDNARRRLERRHDRNRELARRAVSHGRRRF
jgi:hypothetical protein